MADVDVAVVSEPADGAETAAPAGDEQPVETELEAVKAENGDTGDQVPVDADADNSNKRKFDEEVQEEGDDEGPAKKKPVLDGPSTDAAVDEIKAEDPEAPEAPAGDAADPVKDEPAAVEQPDQEQAPAQQNGSGAENGTEAASETMACPRNMVGKLIGREGSTIKDLQTRSGARIQVDHSGDGPNKTVTLTGTRDQVNLAKTLITQTLDDTPSATDVEKTVDCPPGIVGRIIGRGGETIKALQSASNAHILVNQDFPEGQPRKIQVTGKPEFVDRAVKMITEVIQGDSASVQSIIQKYGETRVLSCPKNVVGRIIGKGGETIKALQKDSQSSIQIDQSSDPSKITVVGKRPGVDLAVARLQALINDEPFHGGHQYPPAGGGYGAGARPPYGGGAPGFTPPYAGPPGGYGGYGAYPSAGAGGYGAYGGYGGYPPYSGGQYGGYGGYGSSAPAAPAAADPYASSYQSGGAGGYGAAAAAAASSASVWSEQRDSEGRVYYYNSKSGVSQWEKPADMP